MDQSVRVKCAKTAIERRCGLRDRLIVLAGGRHYIGRTSTTSGT